ncbi:MAG: hypothetical protein IIA61_06460 [Candidatus Marinimicrobia bacterium]|nr:hypothetical protein [Candidatus Neomarinimicrobiota bacterium]
MNEYFTGFSELRTIMVPEPKTKIVLQAFAEYRRESKLVRIIDKIRDFLRLLIGRNNGILIDS